MSASAGLASALLVGAAEALAAEPLAGAEWTAISVAGEAVPDGVEVALRFDAEGGVSGTGGCNRFAGPYTLDGRKLAFGALDATRMGCPGPKGVVEAAVFGVLERVAALEEPGPGRLTLLDASGDALMALVRRGTD